MKQKMLSGGTRRISGSLRVMLSSDHFFTVGQTDNVFGMPPFDFISQTEHLSFFLSDQYCFNVILVK